MQPKKSLEVLCDFDGTIINDDIGFQIMQTFAGEGWWEIEEAYQRGEKGSREAMTEIFQLISVSEKELQQFVDDNFFLDPYFPAFLAFCRRHEIKVTVVSDGFDWYIERIFAKYNINLPYVANKLQVVKGRLQAAFPYQSSTCGKCGNCKLEFANKVKQKGNSLIYIGDGYSDRCISKIADFLFAKSYLAEFCQSHGLHFYAFTTFADILAELNSLIKEEGKF
ncbi:MAG: MtnX-like HAD-IB family phosphatase [Firmicutes bacterium]|nr:MtnX-like HAD-IB family phosphatase [Bacillota bacterium]